MSLVSCLVAAVLVAAAVAIAFRLVPATERPTVVFSQGPTVERLEQLNHLVTMRVFVADGLTA